MTTCGCGAAIPDDSSYHPKGEDCRCFSTICINCLMRMLGEEQ